MFILTQRFFAWHSLSKMASLARREKYNENRRQRQSKARQAVFITEYFYVKYYDIYKEAAEFYNQVNTQHPHKHDLRKCEAFKKWKAREQQTVTNKQTVTNNQTRGRYHKLRYPDIPVEQAESPCSSEISTESPSSSVTSENQSEQAESPVSTETTIRQKTMCLEIPLMNPSVVTETLSVVTQQEKPLQVAAEGVPQEMMTIQPSLVEELPQDLVDRIIEELRSDPEMATVMTDIEEELEFENLGMELEIPNIDHLEDELENLIW